MFDRINFIKIINAHLSTLRSLNDKSNKIYWVDLVLFFIFPFIVSVLLVYYDISIKELIGELIKSVAIFAAFLFNMLAIIYNSMNQIEQDAKQSKLKRVFIKEIHANLSFNILIGIFLITTLLIYSELKSNSPIVHLIYSSFAVINYFLLILFILTLLMNLNRVFILLNRNIKDKTENESKTP